MHSSEGIYIEGLDEHLSFFNRNLFRNLYYTCLLTYFLRKWQYSKSIICVAMNGSKYYLTLYSDPYTFLGFLEPGTSLIITSWGQTALSLHNCHCCLLKSSPRTLHFKGTKISKSASFDRQVKWQLLIALYVDIATDMWKKSKSQKIKENRRICTLAQMMPKFNQMKRHTIVNR